MTARLNRRLKTPDKDDVYFNSWLLPSGMRNLESAIVQH